MKLVTVVTVLFMGTVCGNLQNWRTDIGFQFRADQCFVGMLNGVDFFSRGPIKLIYSVEAFLLKSGMRKGDRCEEFRYLGKRVVERAERQPALASNVENVRKIVDQALKKCVNCAPLCLNTSSADSSSTTSAPAVAPIQYPTVVQPFQPTPIDDPSVSSTTMVVGPPGSPSSGSTSTTTTTTGGLPSNGTSSTSTTSIVPGRPSNPLGNATTGTTIVTSTSSIEPTNPPANMTSTNSTVPASSNGTNSANRTTTVEDATETISTDTATSRTRHLL